MKFHAADVNVDSVVIAAVDLAAAPPLPPHLFVVRDVLSLPRTSLSKKKPVQEIRAVPSYFDRATRFAAVIPLWRPA